MPEAISFGTWLRQRRRALDLTQKAFADQVGCAEITVRRMEADEYRPSNELAFVLFEKLGIPEAERSQWVSFARGLAENPNAPVASSPSREQSTNLPIQLTSFIGREKEITEVCHLIVTHRLVTLTGSGGTGKTRLSLQVASELRSSFSDGVWLVEFASLSDPTLVPFSLANLFGLRESGASKPSITELLVEYFRLREVLIIFDNCEHLIEATARLADLLLQSSSKLCILATSREALRVKGEIAYRVPSLDIPNIKSDLDALMKSESACLFVERALDSEPNFSLTPNNASIIVQICQHLDGIPLALELAAARVKMMTVEEIAKRLADRFRLLSGGMRTDLPRHQTLRAMIDWSYNLLAEEEKALFCRLAAFVGGWTLEAAEAVCSFPEGGIAADQILELLSQLINKSLVTVEYFGIESRYNCLETIRQYAHEKLLQSGESEIIRDRHLQFFLKLAEDAERRLSSDEQVRWLARLDQELDNLRAAINYAFNTDEMMVALRLEGALWYFLYMRGYHNEGRSYMKETLSRSRSTKPVASRAKVLNGAGFIAWVQGDYVEARSLLEHGLIIGRELDDKSSIAVSLRYLGAVALSMGEFVFARSCLEEVLSMSPELVGSDGLGWSLNFLGDLEIHSGNYAEAKVLFERSVILLRRLDAKDLLAYPLRRLGQLALHHSDPVTAKTLCRESLELNLQVGDRRAVAACIVGMATISLEERKYERVAILLAAVDLQLDILNASLFYTDGVVYEHTVKLLGEVLDKKVYAAAYAVGRAMTLEQAIDFALEEN